MWHCSARAFGLRQAHLCQPASIQLKLGIISLCYVAQSRVLVATPLRAVRAIKRRRLEPAHIKMLILDEADHLMAGKFLQHVDTLVGALHRPSLVRTEAPM